MNGIRASFGTAAPAVLAGLVLIACAGDSTGTGGLVDETPGGGSCGNEIGNGNQIVSGPASTTAQDHDQPFRSLTVDPANPDIVYIGTERNGIVRTRNGGNTWERLRQGLRHVTAGYSEVWDLAIAPGNPALLIAATTDSPGPLTGEHPSAIGGIYRSTDGGNTWQRANCGLSNGSVASVSFANGSATVVVIAVSGGRATFSALAGQFFAGGLFRSTDGGRNWSRVPSSPTDAGRSRFSHIRTVRSTGTLVTFAIDYEDPARSIGFLSSEDNGANWLPLPDPLAGRVVADFDVSSDGATIWADAADTFRMLRTRDGGASWTEIGAFSNGSVAVSPVNPDLVLFEDFGTLRRSTDGLATWTTVLTSARRFDDIVFAPSDPRIVYAVTEGYDVYRSGDTGASFRLLVNLRATVLR